MLQHKGVTHANLKFIDTIGLPSRPMHTSVDSTHPKRMTRQITVAVFVQHMTYYTDHDFLVEPLAVSNVIAP